MDIYYLYEDNNASENRAANSYKTFYVGVCVLYWQLFGIYETTDIDGEASFKIRFIGNQVW